MYSSTPTGKASKDSVQVISSHDRLQLRFRFGAKRHYVSIAIGRLVLHLFYQNFQSGPSRKPQQYIGDCGNERDRHHE